MDCSGTTLLIGIAASVGAVLAAVAAIVTAWATCRQVQGLKASLQAESMLKLVEKFDSPPFEKKREAAAKACLFNLKNRDPGDDVDEVLDFFDDAAFLVKRGALDIEMMWHPFYHWIRLYYQASEKYVSAYREKEPAVWNFLDLGVSPAERLGEGREPEHLQRETRRSKA